MDEMVVRKIPMSEEMFLDLERIASRENISMNEVITRAAREHMEACQANFYRNWFVTE